MNNIVRNAIIEAIQEEDFVNTVSESIKATIVYEIRSSDLINDTKVLLIQAIEEVDFENQYKIEIDKEIRSILKPISG